LVGTPGALQADRPLGLDGRQPVDRLSVAGRSSTDSIPGANRRQPAHSSMPLQLSALQAALPARATLLQAADGRGAAGGSPAGGPLLCRLARGCEARGSDVSAKALAGRGCTTPAWHAAWPRPALATPPHRASARDVGGQARLSDRRQCKPTAALPGRCQCRAALRCGWRAPCRDFMQRFLEVQSQGTGTILAARLVPAGALPCCPCRPHHTTAAWEPPGISTLLPAS